MLKHTVAILLLASLQSPVQLLDLINKPRSTDEEYLAVPASDRADQLPTIGVTADSAQIPPTPFELSGLQFNQVSYTVGDEFIVEVSLRYLGTEQIFFPISTEAHLFRKSMPNLRVITLGVAFKHEGVGRRVQVAETLFGADEIPGSLIQIEPNGIVRIRTSGKWGMPTQVLPATITWPLTVKPTVDFNLFRPTQTNRAVTLLSSETIVLTRPQ